MAKNKKKKTAISRRKKMKKKSFITRATCVRVASVLVVLVLVVVLMLAAVRRWRGADVHPRAMARDAGGKPWAVSSSSTLEKSPPTGETVRLQATTAEEQAALQEAATGTAKAQIADGMAAGVQNNIELRKMLADKFIASGDYNSAIEQHRHIVRIQTEKFGTGSNEADAAMEAVMLTEKAKIAHNMALGVQNNIELRKMLADKFVASGDYESAIDQHRHIVRIQTEKFGAGSAEVDVALEVLGFVLVKKQHAEL